ncbi:MAG: inorganic diphosphatase [Alphaproteobacteria bacterium]|jgi:inorganic pyrophosphatase|nr:inorganic diphosphatase [Alphaproteobacteria bacterium]MCV6599730.1 inorganic diphosphatase [Alphaproteobacteria bacterium]
MNLDAIPAGKNPPTDLFVVIEIPKNEVPVKYEIDKDSSMFFVDRFLNNAMRYPHNYGFIPNTLASDGDPLDALVVTHSPLMAGCVVRCVPIGVFEMEDEKGMDEKIICVPHDELNPYYKAKALKDLPHAQLAEIEHFFSHYKDLEKGKWVRAIGFKGIREAKKVIKESIKNYGDK